METSSALQCGPSRHSLLLGAGLGQCGGRRQCVGLQGLPLLELVCLRSLMGKEVVALREGLYPRNLLLSLVRGPDKLRVELLTVMGRGQAEAGKVELVTLAIPTHTQPWVGRGCSRPQPGRNRDFTLLLGLTYFSGSPTGKGKAERGSSTGEWGGGLAVGCW